MFPLDWQCCYVPRLPDVLKACLEYPGGFVIGMQLVPGVGGSGGGGAAGAGGDEMGMGTRLNAEVGQGGERRGIDVECFLEGLELQETVHIVDLDLGTVSRAGGHGLIKSGVFNKQPYHALPTHPTNDLLDKLKGELKRVGMVAGRGDGLVDYDSAFEVSNRSVLR